MRKGRDGENGGEMKENNGENSGPLTSLPVNRLTATDCNAPARAKTLNTTYLISTHHRFFFPTMYQALSTLCCLNYSIRIA